ncbi:hypothetical protein [Pseudomonas sp. S2_H01]
MNAFAGKRAPTGSVVKAPSGHGLTADAISRALSLLTAQQKIKNKSLFINQLNRFSSAPYDFFEKLQKFILRTKHLRSTFHLTCLAHKLLALSTTGLRQHHLVRKYHANSLYRSRNRNRWP